MRVLWEVEGQHERFRSGVFDFHPAAVECGLGDESDLGIEFAQFHVLVVLYRELADPAAATMCFVCQDRLGIGRGMVFTVGG